MLCIESIYYRERHVTVPDRGSLGHEFEYLEILQFCQRSEQCQVNRTEATGVLKLLSRRLQAASYISLISLRHLHHHHQQYKWWLLKKCLDDSINILPCFAAGQALCFYFHNLSQIQIIVLFVVSRFNLYSMLMLGVSTRQNTLT